MQHLMAAPLACSQTIQVTALCHGESDWVQRQGEARCDALSSRAPLHCGLLGQQQQAT